MIGKPVALDITQYRVGTEQGAAEAAQVAAAQAEQQEEAVARRLARIGERLALIAGVSPDAVLIDREHRRAVVRAQPIEGASLLAYRLLEQRVQALP